MERPWSIKSWRPTVKASFLQYHRPPPPDIKAFQKGLQECTQRIQDVPYDPQLWRDRGKILTELGYPELAVGDLYKARMLIDAAHSGGGVLSDQVNLHFGMATWYWEVQQPLSLFKDMTQVDQSTWRLRISAFLSHLEKDTLEKLARALMFANCVFDALQLCRQASEKFPRADFFRHTVDDLQRIWKSEKYPSAPLGSALPDSTDKRAFLQEVMQIGGVLVHPYPWMKTELLKRSDAVIRSASSKLAECSKFRCELQQSPVRSQSPAKASISQSDVVLGVYALKDLEGGATIVMDHTAAGVAERNMGRCECCSRVLSGSVVRLSCCEVPFCTTACANLARSSYHPRVCCSIESNLQISTLVKEQDAQSTKARERLLLRVLAMIVQQSPDHPLDATVVAELTAQYAAQDDHLTTFSMPRSIAAPIKMLEALGIDVFANHSYDTWVLRTIQNRIQTNVAGTVRNGVKIEAIGPMYSFFNHSCMPNMSYDWLGDSTTLVLKARQDIKKGEELFIAYDESLLDDVNLARRRTVLMKWLQCDCQCMRCQIEAVFGKDMTMTRMVEM